jgi:REP element-mobilizing transposase RayT
VTIKGWRSLAHTKWDCKYHLVIVPKYRKKILYGDLYNQKSIEILESHAMPVVHINTTKIKCGDDGWICKREKCNKNT